MSHVALNQVWDSFLIAIFFAAVWTAAARLRTWPRAEVPNDRGVPGFHTVSSRVWRGVLVGPRAVVLVVVLEVAIEIGDRAKNGGRVSAASATCRPLGGPHINAAAATNTTTARTVAAAAAAARLLLPICAAPFLFRCSPAGSDSDGAAAASGNGRDCAHVPAAAIASADAADDAADDTADADADACAGSGPPPSFGGGAVSVRGASP
eukprot:CAMPEP_0181037982 /NCGR_PEP_ID=MMETSP1070-20121207/9695_1 /TAXON_ID=265543 /ORGANISM="Minutocellus polymorphus, Strain NH13" /LENGTH=207 /DNA_ID=CAMNT_0023115741 /DNA_START=408 /DNA_END=1032 /DNA_ORIENTATION=+